ncbi:hypothetical protein RhiirC2_799093 [Rhizophagus irregularis]|uniref:Uncharacterized protein n=1 Tax=Rhizophagus irregularis TaxID=588596 RepID=A0A2N1M5H1_9GLOM|nr:hypothetical protein RhiirC2_799093 [Rhizophagus irregularis]
MSRMQDKHTREEADAKQLIKKDLTPEQYLYEIPEPDERFEYVVAENDSSQKVGTKWNTQRYQPSYETVLEALKRLKDGKKADGDKVDDDGVDEDDLDEEKEDGEEVDEDEVSKIRDDLAQKSAEKWVRDYIKNLYEGPKKDEAIISHLWKGARIYVKKLFDTTYADKGGHLTNNAYYQSFLNALDKQEESICLKLSSLLKEISEVDIEYRDKQYLTSYYLDECKLLADFQNTWYKVVGLEITRYRTLSKLQDGRTLSKLQDGKKDDSSEADIDEIIKLYG